IPGTREASGCCGWCHEADKASQAAEEVAQENPACKELPRALPPSSLESPPG
ncbi:hypothetical protein Tco_1230550, partial [Tanacetum coccineum]